MSLCQIWCLHCLWKPSPGGLSMDDLTPPRKSPREPPCLPLHSSRKRAPGPDRLHARTAGQGALRGMPASGCPRSFSTRFPGALEPISTWIIASLPLSGKASLHTEIGMASCRGSTKPTQDQFFIVELKKCDCSDASLPWQIQVLAHPLQGCAPLAAARKKKNIRGRP